MPASRPFVVLVADLVHRPGARRAERITAPTAEMHVGETQVRAGAALQVDAILEEVSDGIVASGSAAVAWAAPCRRCLKPVDGTTQAEFRELYTRAAVEGETYPLVHESVDLELVAREAILLDLPLAPLCREECQGLCSQCGADLNEGPCSCAPTARDPRWAALDVLRAEMGATEADEAPGQAEVQPEH